MALLTGGCLLAGCSGEGSADAGRKKAIAGKPGPGRPSAGKPSEDPRPGDFNGDGRPDVVVDTPGFRRHDGRVTLLRGGPGGVPSADGEQTVDAETDGLPGTPNPHRWNAFDHRPPLLDVDGDAHADAIVFAPLYEKRRGAFLVLRGTPEGFTPEQTQLLTPTTLGVPLHLP